jgi:hypothetical protein
MPRPPVRSREAYRERDGAGVDVGAIDQPAVFAVGIAAAGQVFVGVMGRIKADPVARGKSSRSGSYPMRSNAVDWAGVD